MVETVFIVKANWIIPITLQQSLKIKKYAKNVGYPVINIRTELLRAKSDLKTINTTNTMTIHNLLSDPEIVDNTLFILDQGWNQQIRECSEAGASIILPNLALGASLLAMTVMREGRNTIATTVELWEQLKQILCQELLLCKKLNIILFK